MPNLLTTRNMTRKYNIFDINNNIIGQVDKKKDLDYYFNILQNSSKMKLKNEFFEILDNSGKRTGNIKLRDHIHIKGDWHETFNLHMISKEKNNTYIHFQKRSSNKDIAPDKIDTIVAGHYDVGESRNHGIIRETKEEIGENIVTSQIKILGRRKWYNVMAKPFINNEFQDTAYIRIDKPLNKYTLQKEELKGIIKIEINTFIKLMKGEIKKIQNVNSFMFEDNRNIIEKKITIYKSDFIETPFDNYFLKIALIIKKSINKQVLPKNPFDYDVTYFFN